VVIPATLTLIAFLHACAETPRREIILEPDTAQIEGWFDARGELVVFPDKLNRVYDPFSPDESRHCVTVVTESVDERNSALKLSGRRVRVWGRAVLYDELTPGTSVGDRLLSKLYYKDMVVENSCLRRFVFVAQRIEAI
jgi:hypothetical protein